VEWTYVSTNNATDESVSLGDKEIAQAVDEAGRIVVKIWRGRFGGKLRESSEPRAFDPLDDVEDTKTCKEVVYKHNVSHVTTYGYPTSARIRSRSLTKARHVPLRPYIKAPSRPGAYQREWIRAGGPKGKPIVFTIRYRSRGKRCVAHYHHSYADFFLAALVGLGIKGDVDDAPSASETADSADVNLNSVGRTASSDFASMLGTFQVSLDSRSDQAYDSDDSSDEEDLEKNNGSDATPVADGEECDSDSDPRTDKDVILVSDADEDGEEDDSGSVPHNRNDPILVTDGEESDSECDVHNDPDKSVEPRQKTPTRNGEEIRLSRSHEVSVESQQTTTSHSRGETYPSRSNEEPMDQQRQKAEAHAEIQQRVVEYMAREEEPDQARAITAVKRKIKDGQMEDFPSAKRYLMTLADEATEV